MHLAVILLQAEIFTNCETVLTKINPGPSPFSSRVPEFDYSGQKYYGRKGFCGMCAGDQNEPGTIHIQLTI